MTNQGNSFVGFEYMEAPAKRSMESLYVDSYRSFGWEYEGTFPREDGGQITMKFKRDRRIRNKEELSRLQRQFESCAREIEAMERSRTAAASIAAFSVGIVGTAFLGGSVFAYLNGFPPLMVVLAVPGFLGWLLPYFCYRKIWRTKTEQAAPMIEQKYDEIYAACKQGCRLLSA